MMTRNELRAAREFLSGMSGGVYPTPVLCAVSGGLDSMCLLHLLSTWGRERNMTVTAAHFNHQLRGAESDRDEQFVRDWCAAHGVPFVSGRGDVPALAAEEGLSLEEAARNARYAFLAQQQREGGYTFVLTAHHADDNAETMLLNLLRGTGLRGLSGIPAFRGALARPFLRITRQELAEYAAEHHIPHVEDATNADPDAAARNRIRLQVMPLLKELNPRAVENMTRTAELLAQDEQALELAAGQLLRAARAEPGVKAELPLECCEEQPKAVWSRAIWSMMCVVCGRQKDLACAHVEAVCDLVRGVPGREVSLPYGMTARREADALVIFRSLPLPESVPIQVGQTAAFGRWSVTLSDREGDRALSVPAGAELTVTAWRRDDRLTLPGSRGARSFKRLCADRGIPPAQRDLLPVLRVSGRAAAAPGIGLDMEFAPREDAVMFVTFYQQTEEKRYEK